MNRILPMLALVPLLAGCAAAAPDLEAEKAALLETDHEWQQAAARMDVDGIVSYWADDAVVYSPGQPPVQGRAALREMVQQIAATPGAKVEWQTDEVVLSDDGTMAYMRGPNAFTMPDATGDLETMRGTGVSIWRKQADGSWKCVVDLTVPAPPPSADAGG